jgi:hypothetical protein
VRAGELSTETKTKTGRGVRAGAEVEAESEAESENRVEVKAGTGVDDMIQGRQRTLFIKEGTGAGLETVETE